MLSHITPCYPNFLFISLAAGAGVQEIHFTLNREGRPSGEAFISFADDKSYNAALQKDHDNMGHRYVEGTLLLLFI